MDHAADYQKLLKVLLTEISAVWLYQLKEFMNHLGNSLIMAGTESSFQNFLQRPRSEEHTSELQSLMRISYAVFCLKKKKTHQSNHTNRIEQKKNKHNK